MSRYDFIVRGSVLATIATVLLMAAVPAGAQGTDPITGNATALHLQNQYIHLVYGMSGTPAVVITNSGDTNFAGRWGIATTGGDPDTALDDYRLAFAWNFLSYQIEPQIATQQVRWYRLGNSQSGSYSVGPTRDGTLNQITSRWVTGGTIAVPQGTGTVQQPPNVEIEEKLTVVRDMVRAEYRFINTGGLARRVRVRLFADPAEDGVWVVGRQQLEIESDFLGGRVPEDWRIYCPIDLPELVLRGIMGKFGASIPNRFVVAATGPLAVGPAASPWDYVINPTVRLSGVPDPNNDACASYFNTFDLMPNQSKTFVAYYGLGVAEEDPTPPYVLATQAPRCLGFVLGDDTTTSGQEVSYASPSSFTIQGFMYNVAEFDIQNASLYLTLPAGLRLASGESAVQSIGTIMRQEEGVASWRVEVDPGVSGVLSYTVTSSGMPVNAKTVTGSIEIPAQARHSFQAGATGMVSVPFQFSNSDASVALGLAPDRIRMARWDPTTRKYIYYPDSGATAIEPGRGFWFKTDLNTTITLQGATPVARSLTANYVLPIKQGWNMIGDPFVYAVPWANTRVSDGTQTMSLTEAAQTGWIRSTLFRYNPNLSPPGYEFSSMLDSMLEPWVGYWVRAERDLFLLIPKVTTPYADIVAPDQRSGESLGWRIQLAARTRTASDLFNFAGAAPDSPDGYDLMDIDEPPAPTVDYVSLAFQHTDWGAQNGSYTQDMRSADIGTGKVWNVVVRTGSDGDVTLTWPRLNAQLPRGLSATLEDTATGRRILMATQGAYTFHSTAASPRTFRLTVTRRGNSRLVITGVQMRKLTGRASARSIHFESSGEGTVDVRVLSPSGKVIREVASRAPAVPGMNRVVWDGTNRAGATMNSGLVLIEISGTAPDGTATRVVVPSALVR